MIESNEYQLLINIPPIIHSAKYFKSNLPCKMKLSIIPIRVHQNNQKVVALRSFAIISSQLLILSLSSFDFFYSFHLVIRKREYERAKDSYHKWE